jgi:hypothetical protein
VKVVKRSLRATLAGAVLAGALVVPAAAQEEETPKPVFQSAKLNATSVLKVTVGTDPAETENTYGYMMVSYLKWNASEEKYVRLASDQAVWNSSKQAFESKFKKAVTRGKCRLIANYQQYLSTPYEKAPVTKARRDFKCGQGF